MTRQTTRLIAALTLTTLLVASCGFRESRLNPFNWFGRDREERIQLADEVILRDPRPLVNEVISLKVDRFPAGAIIHTFGLPQTQGYWNGELVPLNDELPVKGVLSYEFRISPPPGPRPAGTQPSREVVIGHFVSDQTLLGVRSIEVIASQNRRSVRR